MSAARAFWAALLAAAMVGGSAFADDTRDQDITLIPIDGTRFTAASQERRLNLSLTVPGGESGFRFRLSGSVPLDEETRESALLRPDLSINHGFQAESYLGWSWGVSSFQDAPRPRWMKDMYPGTADYPAGRRMTPSRICHAALPESPSKWDVPMLRYRPAGVAYESARDAVIQHVNQRAALEGDEPESAGPAGSESTGAGSDSPDTEIKKARDALPLDSGAGGTKADEAARAALEARLKALEAVVADDLDAVVAALPATKKPVGRVRALAGDARTVALIDLLGGTSFEGPARGCTGLGLLALGGMSEDDLALVGTLGDEEFQMDFRLAAGSAICEAVAGSEELWRCRSKEGRAWVLTRSSVEESAVQSALEAAAATEALRSALLGHFAEVSPELGVCLRAKSSSGPFGPKVTCDPTDIAAWWKAEEGVWAKAEKAWTAAQGAGASIDAQAAALAAVEAAYAAAMATPLPAPRTDGADGVEDPREAAEAARKALKEDVEKRRADLQKAADAFAKSNGDYREAQSRHAANAKLHAAYESGSASWWTSPANYNWYLARHLILDWRTMRSPIGGSVGVTAAGDFDRVESFVGSAFTELDDAGEWAQAEPEEISSWSVSVGGEASLLVGPAYLNLRAGWQRLQRPEPSTKERCRSVPVEGSPGETSDVCSEGPFLDASPSPKDTGYLRLGTTLVLPEVLQGVTGESDDAVALVPALDLRMGFEDLGPIDQGARPRLELRGAVVLLPAAGPLRGEFGIGLKGSLWIGSCDADTDSSVPGIQTLRDATGGECASNGTAALRSITPFITFGGAALPDFARKLD